jgi:hypothetical protein
MARSCGIYIGRQRWAVVVLDGSAKKHKVVLQDAGTIPPGDDPIQTTARELREVAKRVKVPSDAIGLAVDSGLAAYRVITLPFDDASKIEDVIKFEVESDLPQWDIDSVIVDFLPLSNTPGVESTLLVTAVPKDGLEARIKACERAGLEPYEAELDTTALFNAAHAAGMLTPDGAQILVHVGDATTSVVIVDGGHLNGMRSIHTGATPLQPAGPEASTEGADAVPEDVAEGAEGQAPERAELTPEQIDRFRAASAVRIRRELARTLSGLSLEHPIQGIFATGILVPELFEGPVLDVPVQPFPGFPGEGDDIGENGVAYGAALRMIGGGVLKGTLRREELRFTGKFERLELPLAVLGMLLLTSLWVMFIVIDKQIAWRGEGRLPSGPDDRGEPGDMQIWLTASNGFMLPDPDKDYKGRLTDPPQKVEEYARRAQAGEIEGVSKMRQLQQIETLLDVEIGRVRRELGQSSDVQELQPQSAFEALTTVLNLMDDKKDEIGRVGIRGVDADTQGGRASADPYVVVKLDVDFFADSDVEASEHYNALQSACEAEPWCRAFERKKNTPLDGNKGIYVDGMTIQVDTRKIPKKD